MWKQLTTATKCIITITGQSVCFDFLEILLFVFICLLKFIYFVQLSIDKFQLNSYDFMSSVCYTTILRWLPQTRKLPSHHVCMIVLLAHSWFSHRKLWCEYKPLTVTSHMQNVICLILY